MGMCHKPFGSVSIETRNESFRIHAEEGHIWPPESPHPEFLLEDLNDLIDALLDAKKYVIERYGESALAKF